MAHPLLQLLEYAVLAPSRHNSQPWLFEIEGPELRVFGDFRRALRAADPHGRELVMACGAAVHNVEVAARAAGALATVEVGAGSRKDGLLARVHVDPAGSADAEDTRLRSAIALRRTNRFGFDARPVPAGLVSRLIRAGARLGARVRVVDDPIRTAVAEVVRDGARAQWSTARFRSEVAAWSRGNDARARDGIPGYTLGLSDPASMLHRVLVRMQWGGPPEELREWQYALHGPVLLAISTPGDGGADWFAAGRAMQSVLLHAASEGLSASFFGAAVEVPAARARLREALGETGAPQVLLRIGYGRALRAVPRRPVSDVVRSFTTVPAPHAIVRAGRDPAGART